MRTRGDMTEDILLTILLTGMGAILVIASFANNVPTGILFGGVVIGFAARCALYEL